MITLQQLCWLLSDEGFPSLDDGKQFINWAKDKNCNVLNTKPEESRSLFKEFKQERLMSLLKKRV